MMGIKAIVAAKSGIFVFGAIAGGVIGSSPAVRNGLRALTKKAIKSSLVLKDEVQALAEKAREDWQDLVAEARAEIVAERGSHTETAHDDTHDHPH